MEWEFQETPMEIEEELEVSGISEISKVTKWREYELGSSKEKEWKRFEL